MFTHTNLALDNKRRKNKMTKRSNKRFKLLDRYKELTSEVRNQLEQKKKALEKDLAYIDKLLLKPTLEPKNKEEEEYKDAKKGQ